MGEIEWLLDCVPRPAQLEALSRSYLGIQRRENKYGAEAPVKLPHWPHPAPGWAHFLEMRLGKTPILLNEFMLLRRDHGCRWLVVLAPNKYKDAWVAEAQRFGVDVPALAFRSGAKGCRELAQHLAGAEGLVVVNYEALVQRAVFDQLLEHVLARGAETMLGADESVMMKNKESWAFKRGLKLSQASRWKRILTGKPVVQGVHDLWAQLRVAGRLDGVSYYVFRNRYAVMGGFRGKQVVGAKDHDRLQGALRLCSFSARRQEWGNMHAPDIELVDVGLSPAQREAYTTMERDFMVWLNGREETVSIEQAVTKHLKLQQISSGYILDETGRTRWIEQFKRVPKVADLLDRLENYIAGKTLVVFYFQETGDQLLEVLQRYNPAVIRGSSWMQQRGLEVEREKARFNSDPACRVLLGQISAVKYGHTLVGSEDDRCETTIFFENSYSLDDRAQAEMRNQGEHQKRAVALLDYCCTPAERAIVTALQKKERVAAAILGYYERTEEMEGAE